MNLTHTGSIEGMSVAESQDLLHLLYEHSTQDDFVCRFKWQKDRLHFGIIAAVNMQPLMIIQGNTVFNASGAN